MQSGHSSRSEGTILLRMLLLPTHARGRFVRVRVPFRTIFVLQVFLSETTILRGRLDSAQTGKICAVRHWRCCRRHAVLSQRAEFSIEGPQDE